MAKKKVKVDWVKRRIVNRQLDCLNVCLRILLSEYQRVLRWDSAGMTEKERVYFQKQCVKIDEATTAMTKFRCHIFDSLKFRRTYP